MKTQTTYSDKSLLTILLCFVNLIFNKLFCNSSLPQQVCSANCSAILLFLNRSALHHVLLSFCSSSTLPVICSVSDMHFISFCTSIKLHPQHLLLSPFLLFHSFSIQNNQPRFSLAHFLLYTLP
jgi:hypothetical protein